MYIAETPSSRMRLYIQYFQVQNDVIRGPIRIIL